MFEKYNQKQPEEFFQEKEEQPPQQEVEPIKETTEEFFETENEALEKTKTEDESKKRKLFRTVSKALTVVAAAGIFFMAQPKEGEARSYHRHPEPGWEVVEVIIHEGSEILQKEQQIRKIHEREVASRLRDIQFRVQQMEQILQSIHKKVETGKDIDKNQRIMNQMDRMEDRLEEIQMMLRDIQGRR